MAKEKNKNATKSFVMLIVTGVVLVAVTLCWFAITDRSNIDKIDSNVENEASSNAAIYYGADASGEIAIREVDIKEYKKIDSNTIELINMIPGAEYFYRAEFTNCPAGKKLLLSFDDIDNTEGSLSSSIEVTRKVVFVDASGKEEVKAVSPEEGNGAILLGSINNRVYEYDISAEGKYRIYYSFKFKDETTSGKENNSLIIKNVNAVVSD